MKEQIDLAVIIPTSSRDDVSDAIASVVHYTASSRIIVVVDDAGISSDHASSIIALSRGIVIISAPPKAPGGHGGLWVKLAAGYSWILERYEPQIILRMDADALIIGKGLEEQANQIFNSDTRIGLLGSYRIGPDGQARDFSWAAHQLRVETGISGLRYPRRRSTLRSWLSLARRHGYIDGGSVLGGAYIHRYQAAADIYNSGWFAKPWLASSKLGEDHIMSLLTMAAGYQIYDFGGPTGPMALKWRGLPAHPKELLATGKLITHSVRYWQELGEQEVRKIFSEARTGDLENPR